MTVLVAALTANATTKRITTAMAGRGLLALEGVSPALSVELVDLSRLELARVLWVLVPMAAGHLGSVVLSWEGAEHPCPPEWATIVRLAGALVALRPRTLGMTPVQENPSPWPARSTGIFTENRGDVAGNELSTTVEAGLLTRRTRGTPLRRGWPARPRARLAPTAVPDPEAGPLVPTLSAALAAAPVTGGYSDTEQVNSHGVCVYCARLSNRGPQGPLPWMF